MKRPAGRLSESTVASESGLAEAGLHSRTRDLKPIGPSKGSPFDSLGAKAGDVRAGFTGHGGRAMDSLTSANDLSALAQAQESQASCQQKLHDLSMGLSKHAIERAQFRRSFTYGVAGGDHRFIMATEFAVVAIVAIAGIARRRVDLLSSQVGDGSDTALSEGVYVQTTRECEASLAAGRRSRLGGAEWMVSIDESVASESGYLYAGTGCRQKVIVTMSDTFVSLAETHFRDANLGWLIADLNSARIKKDIYDRGKRIVVIENGRSIELPVWEDIVEFYQHRPKGSGPDNLLTMVLRRNLDRAVIDAALASVMAPDQEDSG